MKPAFWRGGCFFLFSLTQQLLWEEWEMEVAEERDTERWTHANARYDDKHGWILQLLSSKWSQSPLTFGAAPGLVVRMSPRLTFWCKTSGLRKVLFSSVCLESEWRLVSLFKTGYNIDIKTQHIQWCQLKFHSVRCGKLGSWPHQRELNNEPCLVLPIFFYLMQNKGETKITKKTKSRKIKSLSD